MAAPYFKENLGSEFDDKLLNPRMQNQAIRETLPTYGKLFTVRIAGAIAGVLVGILPAVFLAVYTIFFGILDSISEAKLSSWTLNYITANLGHIAGYFKEMWLFMIGLGVLGFYLGDLRQRYGFAHQYVRYNSYSEKNVKWRPMFYELAAFIGFPFWLWLCIALKAEIYAKILGFNFSIWLASGVAFLFFWKLLHNLVLNRIASTDRCLDKEFVVRTMIDSEPVLNGSKFEEIVIKKDGSVAVYGTLKDKAARERIIDVIENVFPLAKGNIEIVQK